MRVDEKRIKIHWQNVTINHCSIFVCCAIGENFPMTDVKTHQPTKNYIFSQTQVIRNIRCVCAYEIKVLFRLSCAHVVRQIPIIDWFPLMWLTSFLLSVENCAWKQKLRKNAYDVRGNIESGVEKNSRIIRTGRIFVVAETSWRGVWCGGDKKNWEYFVGVVLHFIFHVSRRLCQSVTWLWCRTHTQSATFSHFYAFTPTINTIYAVTVLMLW